MKRSPFNKLKITAKHLLGSIVYDLVYTKNKINSFYNSIKKNIKNKRNQPNLIKLLFNSWKTVFTVCCLILGIYYGLGASISSKINNRLNISYKAEEKSAFHVITALTGVLKTQIDDTTWTPSLPIIFPAAVLDNLPSFQIGAKNSANYFIKYLARNLNDNDLKEASKLLDYPENIWLFSQTKDEKLAPGTAKQYRKALASLERFLNKKVEFNQTQETLLDLLKMSNSLLDKNISTLNKHIREHSAETLDFNADNLFYTTQGNVYTLHYVLTAITKDYQNEIVATEQYENFTTALKYLTEATELSPLVVKNAAPNDVFEANHLIYLGYLLSLAKNKIQEIYYEISLKKPEPLQ